MYKLMQDKKIQALSFPRRRESDANLLWDPRLRGNDSLTLEMLIGVSRHG